MKVLYYCPEYYFRHGGRTHARGFFHALGRLPGVSGSFLYPAKDPGNDAGHAKPKNKRVSRAWFLPLTIRRLLQYFTPRITLTKTLIDLIHLHQCDAFVMRRGLRQPVISMVKKACPQTIVCLEINSAYFEERFPRLPLRFIFQQLEVNRYKQADAVVVVSSHLKEYLLKRGMPAEKILVNQNGVDTSVTDLSKVDDLRATYNIPQGAFVIGYIGGMETFRRLPEIVGYIAKLRRDGSKDIYLLVVGDGTDMPAMRAAIEAERDALGDSVILTGWQPYEQVPRFLATFDLAIFPFTAAYCSPLKLFEYLGAGVPTLGPDTPAVREVFQDGVHLKLVRQDGSNFIDSILQMKTDPGLRERLSKNGQQLVLNEYTWEKNAERVVKHIQGSIDRSANHADSACVDSRRP